MAETVTDFHHGGQDVSENFASWRRFMTLTKLAALHLAVIILVCGLWFAAGAAFFGGLIPGIILYALGLWFILRKPSPAA